MLCSGWTPYIGNCGAAFPDCEKLVLGDSVRLSLLPGEAMLLGLTCHASCESATLAPRDQLRSAEIWSRRRKRFDDSAPLLKTVATQLKTDDASFMQNLFEPPEPPVGCSFLPSCPVGTATALRARRLHRRTA